jgi:hypothetical protein
MLTRSKAVPLRLSAVTIIGLAVACGGQPAAGPSPIAVPPRGTMAAPAARTTPPPFPAGIDPAYVRTLAVIDADGFPKRWEGGPFHHCFGPGLETHRAFLDRVADRMSTITGIPRTESGACNVTWRIAPDPYVDVPVGGANANLGNEAQIHQATVTFRFGEFVEADAEHESGHVMGLMHSPVVGDVMRSGAAGDFSANELAVLAWIYAPSAK